MVRRMEGEGTIMDELKPCPFCGGEAEMLGMKVPPPLPWLRCKSCGAETSVYATEAEAIAAWNTRAERTCKPVEKDGVMRCPDCDYPLGIMSVPAFCAGCGAKVIGDSE